MGFLKDLLVSVVIVLVIMGILFGYTGVWPPVVVVESGSMRHADDSSVGIIDTGDLTLVKSIGQRHAVITWVEANPAVSYSADTPTGTVADTVAGTRAGTGTRDYGDWGQVIVYRKNGLAGTPVIHRSLIWVEPAVGCVGGMAVPDLKLDCARSLTLQQVGYLHVVVRINLGTVLGHMPKPHAGFLTKGDHNNRDPPQDSQVDQESLFALTGPVQAVAPEWVVGQAQGELPWFGLIKLVVTGQVQTDCSAAQVKDRCAPPSSVRNLVISIALIILIPLAIDIGIAKFREPAKGAKGSGKGRMRPEAEEEDEDEGEDDDDESGKDNEDDHEDEDEEEVEGGGEPRESDEESDDEDVDAADDTDDADDGDSDDR